MTNVDFDSDGSCVIAADHHVAVLHFFLLSIRREHKTGEMMTNIESDGSCVIDTDNHAHTHLWSLLWTDNRDTSREEIPCLHTMQSKGAHPFHFSSPCAGHYSRGGPVFGHQRRGAQYFNVPDK